MRRLFGSRAQPRVEERLPLALLPSPTNPLYRVAVIVAEDAFDTVPLVNGLLRVGTDGGVLCHVVRDFFVP